MKTTIRCVQHELSPAGSFAVFELVEGTNEVELAPGPRFHSASVRIETAGDHPEFELGQRYVLELTPEED